MSQTPKTTPDPSREVMLTPEQITARELHVNRVATYSLKLRQAITLLSSSVKATELQARIDPFVRHVSHTLAHQADTMFPTTVRPHAINRERSNHFGKVNTLIFYVGNAVLGFYDFVNSVHPPAYMGPAEAVLIRRILRLEMIARVGLHYFMIAGDDVEGFYLYNRDANKALKDRICTRTGCKSETAPATHTQTGDMYCIPCARSINLHNPQHENAQELVAIPYSKPPHGVPVKQ